MPYLATPSSANLLRLRSDGARSPISVGYDRWVVKKRRTA